MNKNRHKPAKGSSCFPPTSNIFQSTNSPVTTEFTDDRGSLPTFGACNELLSLKLGLSLFVVDAPAVLLENTPKGSSMLGLLLGLFGVLSFIFFIFLFIFYFLYFRFFQFLSIKSNKIRMKNEK